MDDLYLKPSEDMDHGKWRVILERIGVTVIVMPTAEVSKQVKILY